MAVNETQNSIKPSNSTTSSDLGKSEVETNQEKKRYLSIDLFRGLAIIGMVFVNIISNFENTPAWSKHAIDYGLTYVDLIAPFFIFAISLTYKMSFDGTFKREGYVKAYTRFARRYGALVGFGFIGSVYIFTDEGIKFTWGVLQAIGYAGLFTMFFIVLPRIIRLIIGIGTLVGYQFILNIRVEVEGVIMTLSDLNLLDEHGGVIGTIGYAALMLIGTAIIDDFRIRKKLPILISGFVFIAIGVSIHYIWKFQGIPLYGGLSKERMTVSYVCLTLGLGAALFWLIWFLFDKKDITKGKSRILQPFGRNAIFLYIIHPLLILFTTLYLPLNSHAALVMFVSAANVAVLWSVAFFLDNKGVYIVI
jgi:predicted acyltransferase